MKVFSERLKELRSERGLSQSQLAKLTGISNGAIAFWEIGARIPSAQAIIVLAKFFNVSSDYLLGLSD